MREFMKKNKMICVLCTTMVMIVIAYLLCFDNMFRDELSCIKKSIIYFLIIIMIWSFVCSFFVDKRKKFLRKISIFLLCTLTFFEMYTSNHISNKKFENYQKNNEAYVTGVVYAEQNGIYYEDKDESGFGLGGYYDIMGRIGIGRENFRSDGLWDNGYSKKVAAIIVPVGVYSSEVLCEGNYIHFANGEKLKISDVQIVEADLVVYFKSKKILSKEKNGSIADIKVTGPRDEKLPAGRLVAKKSQYGLQGKLFKYISRVIGKKDAVEKLRLMSIILTAMIFALIVVLIASKYDKIFAFCFFVTFLLAPWIVDYARNLYAVEFTWFVPMAIGLFISLKLKNKKCRILGYILTFIAILTKCLCSYEYTSVVIMGLLAFLIVDFVVAIKNKKIENRKLVFKTLFITFLFAVLGVLTAICIHAVLRGNGHFIVGVKKVILSDIFGISNTNDVKVLNSFNSDLINTSVWEVWGSFFVFKTKLLVGIPAKLFPVLCIIPLCIFGIDYKIKKINTQVVALYIVFLLTSLSWFCFAKSYVSSNPYMNSVLWYFGFFQVCMYVVLEKIVKYIIVKNKNM